PCQAASLTYGIPRIVGWACCPTWAAYPQPAGYLMSPNVLRTPVDRVGDVNVLNAPAARQVFDLVGDVPDAQRKVMGRPGQAPVFDKGAQVRREAAARVGVARGGDGAGQRFPFGHDKLELARVGLRQPDTGDGAVAELDLDADARTTFAVIDAQPAQHRLALCHPDMVRPVMAYQDDI